jgi:hypothetical protein
MQREVPPQSRTQLASPHPLTLPYLSDPKDVSLLRVGSSRWLQAPLNLGKGCNKSPSAYPGTFLVKITIYPQPSARGAHAEERAQRAQISDFSANGVVSSTRGVNDGSM